MATKFLILGAFGLGALTLSTSQLKQKTGAAVPQTGGSRAIARPMPEIVAVNYKPPARSLPAKLTVRAYNPSWGADYAPTMPVEIRIQDMSQTYRGVPATRSIPALNRTASFDTTFDLAPPLPNMARAGTPTVQSATTASLAGLNLQVETLVSGRTIGPSQYVLRWPKDKVYSNEPMNVRGVFQRTLDSSPPPGGSGPGSGIGRVDEHHVVESRGPVVRPSGSANDSPGDPLPTSILRGVYLADTSLNGTDTNIAVGPNAALITVSSRLDFYTKEGQPLRTRNGASALGPMSMATFFQPLDADIKANLQLSVSQIAKGFDEVSYYDARCMFDSYRRRFWVVCLANNKFSIDSGLTADQAARRNKIACAVSKTSDPRDGFWMYWWDGGPYDGQPNTDWKPGDRADYPSIGISPRFMMQTAQVPHLDPGGAAQVNRWAMVTLMNADALAAGRPQFGWMFPRLKDPSGAQITYLSTPAQQYGPSPNSRAYLAKRLGETMLVYGFDAFFDFPRPPMLATFPVRDASEIKTMDQKSSTDVPSPPDVKLDISPITMKFVVRGDRMWTVLPEAITWSGQPKPEGAIRYIRANLASFSSGSIPTTAASGFIERTFGKRHRDDPANSILGYGMPTIDVDRNGNAFIGYLRSGTSIFTEARFSVGLAGESDVRPSLPMRAGEGTFPDVDNDGTYGQLDCTGSSLDMDELTVWFAIPFAFRNSPSSTKATYRIAVGRVRL